ncbi:MAG TPA: carboxypeptidase regulatory-like domain-containing protein, partial [Polyangiaceae bacterium]|nr:carboxypeptidase regulatory-like domain-containing protein [Polyangiaceae bacterium]
MIRSVPALTLLSILCTSGAVSAQVSGVVKDKASGLPVADALVTVQAKGIRAQTDASGNFSLSGASGSGLVIVAAKKGFYNSGVNADAPATNLNIELEGV